MVMVLMKKSNLKKCDWLLAELTRIIDSGEYRPHQRFFSVGKLKALYNVSQATVVETLNRMEMEGRLYRRPSSGTYVSPPQKTRQILLVGRQTRVDNAEMNAFLYQLESNVPVNMNCRITFVHVSEFEQHFSDFDLFFRNTVAVIFFRAPAAFSMYREALERRGILNVFYGSTSYREELGERNCFYYDEKKTVNDILQYLYQAGHRRIGCLYDDFDVFRYRKQLYVDWMIEHGLFIDHQSIFLQPKMQGTYQTLLERPELKFTALFATHYGLGLEAVQALLRRNLDVPRDVSVIGIGTNYACRFFHPHLTTVCIDHEGDACELIRQISAAVSGGTLTIPGGTSSIVLHEEETVGPVPPEKEEGNGSIPEP